MTCYPDHTPITPTTPDTNVNKTFYMSCVQSNKNLGHIFCNIFSDDSKYIVRTLGNEGVNNVIDFINLPPEEFTDLEYYSQHLSTIRSKITIQYI